MKTKKVIKKLALNKETVANFSHVGMKMIKGGVIKTEESLCFSHRETQITCPVVTDTCVTDCGTCATDCGTCATACGTCGDFTCNCIDISVELSCQNTNCAICIP